MNHSKIHSPLMVGMVQQMGNVDREKSLESSIKGIEEAAKAGAQLVLLQELHTGPYFCQTEDVNNFDLAESIPGPTTDVLGEVAKRLKIVLVASLFEKRAPGLAHNTSVVFEKDGTIAGRYRKMHIPDDPGFYEKFYFTPGDLGFTPIKTSVGNLGVLVCWDQWFPEAARLMTLAGADILLYPTAIGWDPNDEEAEKARQREAWITIQRAHAVANGIFVVVCNRVGFEKASDKLTDEGINFWGSSFAAGPQGEILTQASTNKPEVLLVSLDIKRSEKVRRIWPFLRDRRIENYQGLLQRFID